MHSTANNFLRRRESIRPIGRPPERAPLDSQNAQYASAAASHAMFQSSMRGYPRHSVQRHPHLPSQQTGFVEDPAARCYAEMPITLSPIRESQGSQGLQGMNQPPPPSPPPNSPPPSSFRRLRRSKSVFSSLRRRRSFFRQPVSSVHDGVSEISDNRHALRTPRPFGYDEPRHTQKFVRQAKSHDVAMQLARSQFNSQYPDYQITPPGRQFALYMNNQRPEHRPFRKTMREAVDEPVGKGEILHTKARDISRNLKNSVKRLLHIHSRKEPSPTVASDLPNNEIFEHSQENQHSSAGSSTLSDDSADCHMPLSPGIGDSMNICQEPNIPDSLYSNSRVTSWADSTASADTAATVKMAHGEQEPEDRSLIHPSHLCASDNPPRPGEYIDSRRLYSALMRHIDEENAQGTDDSITLGSTRREHAIPKHVDTTFSTQDVPGEEPKDPADSPTSFSTATPFIPVRRRPSRISRQLNVHPAIQNNGVPEEEAGTATVFETICYRSPKKEYFGQSAISDSSSVYSRSTGANTPVDDEADVGDIEPGAGIATILGTQTTPFSPSNNSSSQLTTSGEWNKWIGSEMSNIDRIDIPRPPRAHYRENTQIHSDEDSISSTHFKDGSSGLGGGIRRQGSTSSKLSRDNNFSRPFSRSSSIRSAIPRKSPVSKAPLYGYGNSSPRISSIIKSPTHPYHLTPPRKRPRDMTTLRNPPAGSPTPRREAVTARKVWANDYYGRTRELTQGTGKENIRNENKRNYFDLSDNDIDDSEPFSTVLSSRVGDLPLSSQLQNRPEEDDSNVFI